MAEASQTVSTYLSLQTSKMNGSKHETSSEPPFIPSSIYSGSIEGYYFKAGPHGTGYYMDRNAPVTTEHEQSAANSSADQSLQQKPPKKARFDTSQNQTTIIPSRLLEQAEQDASKSYVVELSLKGLQHATSLLQKSMTRNELERAQQQDTADDSLLFVPQNDPTKYMASEITLYEQIVSLKSVAASPKELYGTIASGTNGTDDNSQPDLLALLCQLLLHPNPDIGASVVSVFLEWMDPSLLDETDETAAPMSKLAQRILLEATDALYDNLDRLDPTATNNDGDSVNGLNVAEAAAANDDNDDDDDEVGKGTEDILSLWENLMEIESEVMTVSDDDDSTATLRVSPTGETVASYLCRQTRLVAWLLQRIDQVNHGDNAQPSSLQIRAMELLANLAPREGVYAVIPDWSRVASQDIPIHANLIPDDSTDLTTEQNRNNDEDDDDDKIKDYLDGIEILLQIVAGYKKRQPADDVQLEFLENACIVMASTLTYSALNVKAFVDCQGIELVVRCLKEKVHAGGAALAWNDFASGNETIHRQACERLVDAGALKYLFPIFMGRSLPKQALQSNAKEQKEGILSMETTVIRIFYGLTRHLSDESPHDVKARFLAKFVDDEKCDRLVELCIAYEQKARMAEFRFYKSEVEDEMQDEEAVQLAALDAKLEGGGDLYHRLAAIVAFCCVGSRQCHERILGQLHLHQSGISLIQDGLEEFASVLDEGEQKDQLKQYLKELL
ncbi:hypothetical protein MPSEU_000336900 [Mayamaea pseudoterrestris]|nr:hypothetical protein MPSEU_000336900 [Mayamaea pseudoterrestris]